MRNVVGRSLRRGSLTMMLAGLAIPLGCDAEAEPMGEVDLVAVVDTDTYIGIIADDDRVIAYVCDGTDSTASLAAWIITGNDGGAFDGQSTLKLATHDVEVGISGTFTDGLASGTLTVDGQASEFTTTTTSGDGGTYRDIQVVDGDEIVAAWVVIGAEIRGAVINRNTGDLFAAGNFAPTAATIDFMEYTFSPAKMTVSNY